MIQIHLLTDDLRIKLKSPLGILLKGSFSDTIAEFKRIVTLKKPPMIISVGDALSEALLKYHILPKVIIIDHKVMRTPSAPIVARSYRIVRLRNDAGTISDNAWTVIESTVRQGSNAKIVVEGEEDLLTLVAILSAPEKSMVVYGQPREGMVIVEVTAAKKDEMRGIVDSMEYVASKS